MKNWALIFITILLSNCNNSTQLSESKNNAITDTFTQIDSCIVDQYVIDSIKNPNSIKRKIEEPIAIEFFHLCDEIRKYDGGKKNSLPERFKHDGRQQIYKTMDEYGFYYDMVIPQLERLKIRSIEGNFKDSTLTFSFNNNEYVISTSYFKENNGVILYIPGKKPILWDERNTNDYAKHCTWEKFILTYFK